MSNSYKQSIINILTREPHPRYTRRIPKLLKHLAIPGSKHATGGLILCALFGGELKDKVLFGMHKKMETYTLLPLQITKPKSSEETTPASQFRLRLEPHGSDLSPYFVLIWV